MTKDEIRAIVREEIKNHLSVSVSFDKYPSDIDFPSSGNGLTVSLFLNGERISNDSETLDIQLI